MSSALAMVLTAAMAVPGNGPEMVSGETVEAEQLAVWRLQMIGARVRYDDRKIGRPVIEVDLSGCLISDESLKELLPLRHLRVLDLRGARVTDKGLKTLEAIQSLRHLDLCDTPLLSRASILRLREAIPNLDIDYERGTGYVPPPAVVP